jgi:carbon-monoxide dehydrogenase medium subunit
MIPTAFDYYSPTTVEETIELLQKYGYEAKILAGGQSLLPMMKLRVAMPSILIDINQVDELHGWREENGYLRIGALTRHADLENERQLMERYPLLSKTAEWIADVPVRNRGTICGSLVHADPGSDWGAAMIALHADVEVIGPSGVRRVSIDDFFVDTFTTSLEVDEIASAVLIPSPIGRVGARYMKLERKAGDFAIVGVALQVVKANDGTILDVGIGLSACGDIPIRAKKAEEWLMGRPLDQETIQQASLLAQEEANPATDLRGSAEYKRDLVRVFVKRGLEEIAAELR